MGDSKRIDDLRAQMQAADVEVLRILERRAKLSREVGQLSDEAPPIVQQHENLVRVQEAAGSELPERSVRSIFKAVYAACASLEGPTRIAFVGNEGSLGHVAARQIFGPGVQAAGTEAASKAFDELARGRVDYAIVPYESSYEGPVLATILALRHTDLVVIGQCELPAGVALMNETGDAKGIEKVYVSPHDRANSQMFLNTEVAHASVIDVRSPSVACQFAAEDNAGSAIAHESIGDIHGLSMVTPNVGDQPELRMRYAVVGTRPAPRTGQDTTSLVFTVNDEPGALLSVLGHLANRNVNLKNIMSRPVPGQSWEYIFYIDVVGHATDRAIVAALDEIKKNTTFVKVLGSYPTRC